MIVIDVSLAASWMFEDERDAVSKAALEAVASGGAAVPAIFQAELENALVFAERAGRVDLSLAHELLADIAKLPIDVDSDTTIVPRSVLALAKQFSLTAYDASYLELAQRRGLLLATRDKQLSRAALTTQLLWHPGISLMSAAPRRRPAPARVLGN